MPSLSNERADLEDTLAAHHLAADDPIERAAVGQLIGAFRHHAGAVEALRLLAILFLLAELLLDPVLQILDRVAADAEFDEMQGHEAPCSMAPR